jgi:hypothetical protein
MHGILLWNRSAQNPSTTNANYHSRVRAVKHKLRSSRAAGIVDDDFLDRLLFHTGVPHFRHEHDHGRPRPRALIRFQLASEGARDFY